MSLVLAVLGSAVAVTAGGAATPTKIFEITTLGAVANGATAPSIFTTTKVWRVTQVTTYHWNNAAGVAPGTVGIKNLKTGKMYGPWKAKGLPGQGGVPNAYWDVKLSLVLPAGRYRVIDSSPGTWAQNAETGGRGVVWIMGTSAAKGACPAVPPTKIFEITTLGAVQNGASVPSVFTTTKTWTISDLMTYHWNNAAGVAPGTVGIKDLASGKMYGPWQTKGLPGQGGVPNAYWDVKPNLVLPAGRYQVVDSDPGTWAQNSETGGRGVVWIYAKSAARPGC